MITFLISTSLFFACEQNDVDPSGSFRIKVVNADPNSSAQSFTLANNILITGGLAFGNASDYLTTHSGNRLVAEFKDEKTSEVKATGELYAGNGDSFTVYMVDSGSSTRVKSFEDDLSAPADNKVRIKFIHLSDGAPSDITIKDASGKELITNISRYIQSKYIQVEPGTLSLRLQGTALRNTIGSFDVPKLQAGKIYTLYLTGETDNSLNIHTVLHN